jgi:MFS transporter, ACS family, aldohexuronate transporter
MTPSSNAIPHDEGPRNGWKWWICFLLLLATTLNYMDRQALALTKVNIRDDIGMDDAQYGELIFVFNIGFGIGALLFGWLVDKVSLRWLYAGLVFAWSTMGFFTGFATAIVALMVCRLLLGVFEAGNWPCGIMTVKRVLPPEQRTLGNGMFQSGTALGAILMPLFLMVVFEFTDPADKRAWQIPFRIVGAVGMLWVFLWLGTVRTDRLNTQPMVVPGQKDEGSYWELWRNRRFLVMAVVIVCVNIPWRTFAEWLPSLLEEGKGYSKNTTRWYTSAYYAAADTGSIMAGVLTLWLTRRGKSLFSSRMFSFALCASLMVLTIAAVLLPKGWLLLCVLLLIGFGALGSFSSYFAFSQDVSAKHQGKVTGTLGLINSLCMGGLALLQGRTIKAEKLTNPGRAYDIAIGLTGLAPLIGVLAIWFFWHAPGEKKAPAASGVA